MVPWTSAHVLWKSSFTVPLEKCLQIKSYIGQSKLSRISYDMLNTVSLYQPCSHKMIDCVTSIDDRTTELNWRSLHYICWCYVLYCCFLLTNLSHCTAHSHLICERLVSLPDCCKRNSELLPRDEVLSVTVNKTGSGAIVVSAKTERKNGIFVQNTNQLAGNRTFIILLTLISFQGKCPLFPFSGLLSLSPCARLGFSNYTLLCPWHNGMTVTHPKCPCATANNCSYARNCPRAGGIMGLKCEAFSDGRCRSVAEVLKGCLSEGLANYRKQEKTKILTRGKKRAVRG